MVYVRAPASIYAFNAPHMKTAAVEEVGVISSSHENEMGGGGGGGTINALLTPSMGDCFMTSCFTEGRKKGKKNFFPFIIPEKCSFPLLSLLPGKQFLTYLQRRGVAATRHAWGQDGQMVFGQEINMPFPKKNDRKKVFGRLSSVFPIDADYFCRGHQRQGESLQSHLHISRAGGTLGSSLSPSSEPANSSPQSQSEQGSGGRSSMCVLLPCPVSPHCHYY